MLDKIRPERAPNALKLAKQWVLWKFIERDGEQTKVPFQISGRPAKSNDEKTWTDFVSVCQRLSGYSGVGYVFSADSGIVGIDLDGCRNPETGNVSEWARELVQQFDSYAEVSPSKTGIKIWVRGKLKDGAGKKRAVDGAERICDKEPAIEVYDRGRYFAVTGWKLSGISGDVEERQAELDWLVNKFFPVQAAPAMPSSGGETESEIIERARAYLHTMPPAISGQGGHNATFKAACVLVLGFGLCEGDAVRLLAEWNVNCNPPWSDRDLARKVREANKQPGERNYLRNARREEWQSIPVPAYGVAVERPSAVQQAPKHDVQVTTLEQAARAYLAKVEKQDNDLVTLGIPEVDAAIGGGVEPGEMVVMAARPSHGKSAIALQFIHHWTAGNLPSLFVSEEMSSLAVGKRTVQFVSDVPQEYWFRNGDEVRRHIDDHFGTRAPCHIVEGCKSAHRAADEIRKAVANHGVKCAVVDYAQLLQSSGKSRYEIVTNTSVILRQVATETKCVLVVLAQINRESEKRDVFVPRNSDLKESGQIEQDADVILLLSWPWKMDSNQDVNKYQFFIGKNRNREIVKPAVEVMFFPSRQMVQSMPKSEPQPYDFQAGWVKCDSFE